MTYLKEKVVPFAQHLYDTGSELNQQRALEMAKFLKYEWEEVTEGRLNAPEDWED